MQVLSLYAAIMELVLLSYIVLITVSSQKRNDTSLYGGGLGPLSSMAA